VLQTGVLQMIDLPRREVRGEMTELAWPEIRGALSRFVASRVPRGEADDVVQDALLRIHRGVGTVRDPQRLTAWIYQVARSAIADRGRRKRPAVAFDPEAAIAASDAVAPVLAGSDDAYAADDAAFVALARCVRPFVAMLAPPYREAIALVELEGVSQVAAAARLGIPLSTLKSRVQRGRAQLRELVEACCAIELDARNHVVDLVPRTCCRVGENARGAEERSR
jgi:RNA polymerase sigma-70 factor (ECF subfamily)